MGVVSVLFAVEQHATVDSVRREAIDAVSVLADKNRAIGQSRKGGSSVVAPVSHQHKTDKHNTKNSKIGTTLVSLVLVGFLFGARGNNILSSLRIPNKDSADDTRDCQLQLVRTLFSKAKDGEPKGTAQRGG